MSSVQFSEALFRDHQDLPYKGRGVRHVPEALLEPAVAPDRLCSVFLPAVLSVIDTCFYEVLRLSVSGR